jgi:hypothetical protein
MATTLQTCPAKRDSVFIGETYFPVENNSQLKEVYGGRVERVHHVRKWCTEFESFRIDIRDKNRTGRCSTRADVEEMNLENQGVTIRSRRFHSDKKLEMAVREWW